jgi:hypothetical protein
MKSMLPEASVSSRMDDNMMNHIIIEVTASLPAACLAVPGANYSYSHPATKLRYVLHTQPASFTAAAGACRASGAQLVSYTSAREQTVVERALLLQGSLIATFHRSYWLGLAVQSGAAGDWGNFTWLDGSPAPFVPEPLLNGTNSTDGGDYGDYGDGTGEAPGNITFVSNNGTGYSNWGAAALPDGTQLQQPDDSEAPELCASASHEQNGSQAAAAWGWADTACQTSMPFICKILPPPPPALKLPPSPPPAPPPVQVNPTFLSASGRTRFSYNSTPADWATAAEACAAAGGWLVTYQSASKQLEVEKALTKQGALVGKAAPFYWTGLKVAGEFDYWPAFSWLTGGTTAAALTARSYSHWGGGWPGVGKEPNRVCPPEDCAGANFTQAYNGTWGWSDEQCDHLFPFVCEAPLQQQSPPPGQPPPPAGTLLQFANSSRKSFTGGARYVYSSAAQEYQAAQAGCVGLGGGLAVYSSVEEQAEVEHGLRRLGGLGAPGKALQHKGA